MKRGPAPFSTLLALLTFLAFPALAAFLAVPFPARADEPVVRPERARSTFRLDYAVFELDGGKRTNDRRYSMTVNEGSQGQLRSGTRVPVNAGDKGIQYVDVGLKISGRVLERDGDLTLDTDIEMSSLAGPEGAKESGGNPVLRTVSQSLSTRPVLGKPAVISSDDLRSGRRLEVEVTVTRLK